MYTYIHICIYVLEPPLASCLKGTAWREYCVSVASKYPLHSFVKSENKVKGTELGQLRRWRYLGSSVMPRISRMWILKQISEFAPRKSIAPGSPKTTVQNRKNSRNINYVRRHEWLFGCSHTGGMFYVRSGSLKLVSKYHGYRTSEVARQCSISSIFILVRKV
jgi:hypothetical protein